MSGIRNQKLEIRKSSITLVQTKMIELFIFILVSDYCYLDFNFITLNLEWIDCK